MDISQSGDAACAMMRALSTSPIIGRYTLECRSGEVARVVDLANTFIDSSPLPGVADVVCYVGEGLQIDGSEPTCTVSVDLPLSAIEPFHRFVTAQVQETQRRLSKGRRLGALSVCGRYCPDQPFGSRRKAADG
jgi:hypothetical protein